MKNSTDRVYLSPPHMSGDELRYVEEAFMTNWIAPLGPNVDAFEAEFVEYIHSSWNNESPRASAAVALSSGTAAIHLALVLAGVGPGDVVIVSSFTFCASVNPILYLGATPVFIDSDLTSWNMDAALLSEALEDYSKRGTLPKAVIVVSLYGQMADLAVISAICNAYGVLMIEDAAEALGAYDIRENVVQRPSGAYGWLSAFSFNGNKIITTSGGGMLVANAETQALADDLIADARKLSTQARDKGPHYEHSMVGYNYRLSNVLAGIGRAQLKVLDSRVATRRTVFRRYYEGLHDLPGMGFMPEPEWSFGSRWLSCITVDPHEFGETRESIRLALEKINIESRPLWKPMHLQPLFKRFPVYGGAVSEKLFEVGLCLPSGSNLRDVEQLRVIDTIVDTCRAMARS